MSQHGKFPDHVQYDWRDRLEAMRLNINTPLEIEPELINPPKIDIDMEEQNGIL